MQNNTVQPVAALNAGPKHALMIGATGATGKDLLNLLLKDAAFHRVDIFVRRKLDLQNDKLNVHVIEFDKPERWKDLVKGDILFSCLGTTLKAAGSKVAQRKIDYSYQYGFAQAARENDVHSYVLVSSSFASASSPFFYSKIKGQLEVSVKALDFPRLIIFNPPLLVRKNSERAAEITASKAIKFLNKIGLFRSQKPLPTEILAQAMINAVKGNASGLVTFKGREIWECAGEK